MRTRCPRSQGCPQSQGCPRSQGRPHRVRTADPTAGLGNVPWFRGLPIDNQGLAESSC
ncbi:MAG: hypothetical protein [Olavius algarvensis Gamma 1 endosymbiont]|nr:MAG: hypothetical protein [Olavius algarvensis Gamma 1 endosymbiont]